MSDFENKIYHTRSFVVFFEKSRIRTGLVWKCSIYIKPIHGEGLRRLQSKSVDKTEFSTYRNLLKGMMKERTKSLIKEIERTKRTNKNNYSVL